MNLEEWADHGWLIPHQADAQELADLVAAAAADLADARKDISPAWRFAIAYNAALRLCSAVLAKAGYRAARDQKHYRTIAALRVIIGHDVLELADFLDQCRTKRHDVTYESLSAVSGEEADELVAAVEDLDRRVRAWLAAKR